MCPLVSEVVREIWQLISRDGCRHFFPLCMHMLIHPSGGKVTSLTQALWLDSIGPVLGLALKRPTSCLSLGEASHQLRRLTSSETSMLWGRSNLAPRGHMEEHEAPAKWAKTLWAFQPVWRHRQLTAAEQVIPLMSWSRKTLSPPLPSPPSWTCPNSPPTALWERITYF